MNEKKALDDPAENDERPVSATHSFARLITI